MANRLGRDGRTAPARARIVPPPLVPDLVPPRWHLRGLALALVVIGALSVATGGPAIVSVALFGAAFAALVPLLRRSPAPKPISALPSQATG